MLDLLLADVSGGMHSGMPSSFGYVFVGLFYFAFARAHDVLSRNLALHAAYTR